jgi:hypothetical protein
MKRTSILMIALLLFLSGAVNAETPAKRTITRADVIEKLSASDFLKKKIGDLLNWGVGYDLSKINRTNLAPMISYIHATPVKLPPDDRTVLLLTAKVSDPKGPDNIRGVRADLSSIKKLPNMMLVDNGLWGDIKAGDGIYTLQTSVGYDVDKGSKDIPVAVANNAGWVAVANTNIAVETNPIINYPKAEPSVLSSDKQTIVSLSAAVINPGRQDDLRDVTIDLSPIGMDNNMRMQLTGDRIYSVEVSVKPGISKGMKKLKIKATNIYGGQSQDDILLTVQ